MWILAGPEFGSEAGKNDCEKVIAWIEELWSSVQSLPGRDARCKKDYVPSYADPDVWLRLAVKPDGTEYYE
jgi:hypothetical protein